MLSVVFILLVNCEYRNTGIVYCIPGILFGIIQYSCDIPEQTEMDCIDYKQQCIVVVSVTIDQL